jgi:hypothetical protein
VKLICVACISSSLAKGQLRLYLITGSACKVTSRRVRVTVIILETQHCVRLFVVEVSVTVYNITVLSVVQNGFYDEFMSPETIQPI